MSVPMSNSGFQAGHIHSFSRVFRTDPGQAAPGEGAGSSRWWSGRLGGTGKPDGPSSTIHGQGVARADGLRRVPGGGAVDVRE